MKRLFALISIIVCSLAACQSLPEKHYHIQAEVISLDEPKKLITVKHGNIPGLMPAMTMTYIVAEPRQVEKLQQGDKISADLVVSENTGRLERIELVAKSDGKTVPGATQRTPAKGESVPDFALTNQDGKTIHLSDYRGRALLISFIYTRCPLLDFCPRMNENFRGVQNLLGQASSVTTRVAFLSISFDPKHDTPIVLKHYASIYKKPSQFDWQFATPSEKDLPALAQFFGLIYQPEEGQIVHSLSTTLIGLDGRIEQWYSGNDWSPSEVATALSSLVQKAS
jgi:protein SCO1/2